ncbi:hypothetical protein H4Q26_017858 [Puccinia striiformis f. sp. tritici PST-130]|nr:hypothetical protein H4Q26_017858 [Puccinia striiformis f. sp. tritici PST-130]
MAGYNVESYLYYPLKHEYTEAPCLSKRSSLKTSRGDTSYAVKSLLALNGTAISSDFDFAVDMCTEEDLFSELEVAQED